jgi:hypothetical protein
VEIRETIAKGDRLESLIVLRDHIAELLEKASPRDASPLSRQLTVIIEKIAEHEKPPQSRVDELAGKRAKRRAGTKVS